MLLDARELEDGAKLEVDVAVVGAGPAGIVTALEVAKGGFDVLLVESGRWSFSPEIQRLGDAHEWDAARHAAMSHATRRQVGGASVIWGGRCVPYDRVDFDDRDFVPRADWPLPFQELSPFFQRACDWFRIGRAQFDAREIPGLSGKTMVPGLPDREVRTSILERWSLPTNFGQEYAACLKRSDRVRLVTGLTCTEVVTVDSSSRVAWLETRALGGKRVRIRARRYVLACGGLETTRLLLVSNRARHEGLGNHSGHLGRWYMAHVDGRIARVRFSTPPRETIYFHERDSDGVYVRRRFSFSREFLLEKRLPNVVAWLVNPELADATHRNGVLSFAYLALSSPLGRYFASEAIRRSLTAPVGARRLPAHLRNVLVDFGSVAAFAATFGYKRFLARRRAPGFFVYSEANVYPLHYHGEHTPNPESRVTLAADADALGMRRLSIDLRFSQRDIDMVLNAHRYWDEYLRKHNCGQLEYVTADLEASVREQLGGGYHQAGTTRMSARPEDGVVGPDLAVHGFADLFVASSSTFVTSGQANSTFMIVVFALRLADHLRSLLSLPRR